MAFTPGYYKNEDERKMQIGFELVKKGWAFHLFKLNGMFRAREMMEWCHRTYGNQAGHISPFTFEDDGRWIAFEMMSTTVSEKTYAIGFENEKMLLMWKMNFGDVIQADD